MNKEQMSAAKEEKNRIRHTFGGKKIHHNIGKESGRLFNTIFK